MPKNSVSLLVSDISDFAKKLRAQLPKEGKQPSHLELLNLIAKANGFQNYQSLKAKSDAQEKYDIPRIRGMSYEDLPPNDLSIKIDNAEEYYPSSWLQYANTWSCLGSNIEVHTTTASSSDSTETKVSVDFDWNIFQSFHAKHTLNGFELSILGEWERSALAASLMAVAEMLEPGIFFAVSNPVMRFSRMASSINEATEYFRE